MSHVPAIRVARALALTVQPLGRCSYRVTGGRSPHLVRIVGPAWSCDCFFASFRSPPCKHVLAVYLARQLGQPVLEALRSAVRAALLEGQPPHPGGKRSEIPAAFWAPLAPDRPLRAARAH
jgi:hypothetical protein